MREAAVMLLIRGGKILSISRRHNKELFGLPGGKLDEGETPEQAAIRETFEETGVKVKSCIQIYKRTEPAGTPDGLPFFTYCFYALEWTEEPRDSEEGLVKWLYESELVNGPSIKSGRGAFPEYNKNTLEVFKKLYPNVKLLNN